jgi:hypothetical protein
MGCSTLIGSSSDATGRLAGWKTGGKADAHGAAQASSAAAPSLSHVVSTYMSCNRRPAAHHRHITYRQARTPNLRTNPAHSHLSIFLSSPLNHDTTHPPFTPLLLRVLNSPHTTLPACHPLTLSLSLRLPVPDHPSCDSIRPRLTAPTLPLQPYDTSRASHRIIITVSPHLILRCLTFAAPASTAVVLFPINTSIQRIRVHYSNHRTTSPPPSSQHPPRNPAPLMRASPGGNSQTFE